jgi:HAD superfamily hydrolase (TIGR01459 family)
MTVAPPLATPFLPGFAALSPLYPIVLSDVWGVVHDGVRAHREACDALIRHRQAGGVVILITNAPRPAGPILAQLDGYGAPREAYDAVVSSGDVTLELMAARDGAPVHFIGPERDLTLFDELARAGAKVSPLAPIETAGYALISGLRDDERETPADYEADLQALRARGLDVLCANPDLVVHRGDDLLYCAGALAQRYEELGGRAIYAGKPHAPIYEKAMRAAAKAQAARGLGVGGRTLCVGDAVRTDLAGAAAQGFDCLFISDGIHRDRFVRGDGSLDEAAFAALLDEAPGRPIAAMRRLTW